MVENHVEELHLAGRGFRFELCRKVERMGDLPVDHWWMDARRVYGQRGRMAAVRVAVTDFFWALCQHHGTAGDPEVQESYILAHLLPYARSNAARRVFADARLTTKGDARTKADATEQLERLLRATRDRDLTMAEFQERTADALGPPVLDPAVVDFYRAFTQEFLGEARVALEADGSAGLEFARRCWMEAIRSWGRRRGFALQKQVLDILSYECRAALHRCYSATWSELVPHLAERHRPGPASLDFLHLWHLDHIREAEPGVPAYFHLFHGHVFALHPAGGDLLRTPTGRELIGAWLVGPDHRAAFGRLLHALYLASHAYALRRDATAEDRRRRPLAVGGPGELARREGARVEGHGRRRPRRRNTDAR